MILRDMGESSPTTLADQAIVEQSGHRRTARHPEINTHRASKLSMALPR
jgi:hypothetical protein